MRVVATGSKIRRGNKIRSSPWLKKFRVDRPILRRSDGKRVSLDSWKKFPLNRGFGKALTEEEMQEEMGDPNRNRDPYERLEFFTKEDLKTGEEEMPQTAMPVDDPHIVRAADAPGHVMKTVERMRMAHLRDMLERKQISKADLAEMKRVYDEAVKDPSTDDFMDSYLHGDDDDDIFVEYPDFDEASSIDRSNMSFVDQLTLDYNIPGYVQFKEVFFEKDIKTPIVRLAHCNGEEATISLHGGCIVSWKDRMGRDRLFRHPDSRFDNRSGVEGCGIGIAFPTFGIVGSMPEDGFAKSMLWDVVRSEVGADWLPDPAPSVTLHCRDTEATRKLWPHQFEIFYKITLGEIDEFAQPTGYSKERRALEEQLEEVGSLQRLVELKEEEELEKEEQEESLKRQLKRSGGHSEIQDVSNDHIPNQLRLQITIINNGDKPMEFAMALKTHFYIYGPEQNSDYVRILGLGGRYYLDYKLASGRPCLRLWGQDYLKLKDPETGWDAIFTENTMNDVFFCPGRLAYFESINRKGFPDVLLRQPGLKEPGMQALADHLTMLGRGRVTVPAKLQPGEKWEGEVILRHHEGFYKEPVFGYDGGIPPPDTSTIEPIREDKPSIIDER